MPHAFPPRMIVSARLLILGGLLSLLVAANPDLSAWKERAEADAARLKDTPTAENYRRALDSHWRADEWSAALPLAEAALAAFPDDQPLRARVVRAYWRGGRLSEAEALLDTVNASAAEPVSCLVHFDLALARGATAETAKAAAELERVREADTEVYFRQIAQRLVRGEPRGVAELVRRAERALNPQGGYPDVFATDMLSGLASFYDQVGSDPLNQVSTYGSAPLPPVPLLNLPSCEVWINGHGPYRLIVDTGGSVMVSLDDSVAEEAGLKTLGEARVRGVSGLDDSRQSLLDEVRIGSIVCRRVMARVFGVRQAAGGMADGILGTGIFHDARMTLDFQRGELHVAPSTEAPGPGVAVTARLIGDAKIICPVKLNGLPGVGLFDSGADVVAFAPSRLAQLYPDHEIRPLNTAQLGIQLGVGSGDGPQISLNPGVDLVVGGRSYPRYSGLGLDVLDTLLGPILGVQCDALLGMAVFRDMRTFTIDYPTVRLWIDWRE